MDLQDTIRHLENLIKESSNEKVIKELTDRVKKLEEKLEAKKKEEEDW